MENERFEIEYGVLKKYRGPGGDVTIPEGVTTIGAFAFAGCTALTSITIPAGVVGIGAGAFSGCTALTSISVPDSVTIIFQPFSGCDNLQMNEYDTPRGPAVSPWTRPHSLRTKTRR